MQISDEALRGLFEANELLLARTYQLEKRITQLEEVISENTRAIYNQIKKWQADEHS